MQRFVPVALFLALTSARADSAHAQLRAHVDSNAGSAVVFATSALAPLRHLSGATAPLMIQAGASYGRVLAGTSVGAVAGAAAGLGVVALFRGDPGDGNMWPWGDLAAGAVLGSIPGMYWGARIASGGSGDPWLTAAAAVGGTAVGILTGVAVGGALAQGDTGNAPEVMGIALGIAIPIGLTSLVEWRTGRRP